MAIASLDVEENNVEDTIRELVTNRCSVELEGLYVSIVGHLFDLNVKFHLDELDLLWSQLNSQSIDVFEIVPTVDEILRTACDRAFTLCGITFTDDLPLEHLNEALDVLLKFDPTELPQLVLDTLGNADDSEEALVKLLVQFGTYEEEDWYPYIEQVSSDVIRRMKQLLVDQVNRDSAAEDTPTGNAEVLRRLSRLLKVDKESIGAELGSSNIGLGASLESLYGCHVERLLDLSIEKQVSELLSLAAISGESFESAVSSVDSCLDDLCMDDYTSRQKAGHIKARLLPTFTSLYGA